MAGYEEASQQRRLNDHCEYEVIPAISVGRDLLCAGSGMKTTPIEMMHMLVVPLISVC